MDVAVGAPDAPGLLACAVNYRNQRMSSRTVQAPRDADPGIDNRIQWAERHAKTDVGTSVAANRKKCTNEREENPDLLESKEAKQKTPPG